MKVFSIPIVAQNGEDVRRVLSMLGAGVPPPEGEGSQSEPPELIITLTLDTVSHSISGATPPAAGAAGGLRTRSARSLCAEAADSLA